jgi:6-phosphogluconolactonase
MATAPRESLMPSTIVKTICSLLFASTLLLTLALAACGGSGSGPTPPCTNCTPTSSDFVYEPNANQVSIFQVDSTSGIVTATPSPATGPALPGGIIATSTNFIYVSDAGGTDDAVYGYSVNTSTGALSPISGSPFTNGLTAPPQGLASDPAGKFLYVTQANNNQIAAFTLGSDGALTPVSGSPYDTGDTYPIAAVVNSAGSFLYVSNNQSMTGTISIFSIDASSGALTAVGSPFPTSQPEPANLAVDPKGNFLYVPASGTNLVLGYSYGSSGTLTGVPGSPFTVGAQPTAVLVDPSGKFLFSADLAGNDISAFTVNSSNGTLTPISGSPFSAPFGPISLAINASSSMLFATTESATGILAFTIDSSGALTSIAPLNGGGTSGGLAIVHAQ